MAEKPVQANIFVWDGDSHALNVAGPLGVEESRGMAGVGAAHYNPLDEVARLQDAWM